MSDASQYLHLSEGFQFKRGGSLQQLTLVYETWGELNPERSNAVLLLTGLSPGAHAASSAADPAEGWWEPMIGPGKPIDTDQFFVLCVNSLGSCKGSTGPASDDPQTKLPYRLSFPELSIEDIAATAQLVVKHLGIERLAALVGPSMGGMSALAYLRQNPHGVEHFLTISSAAAAEPFAIAVRSLQRESISLDPAWNEGQYDTENWPVNGMRMARKLGMISYRSAGEWRERFQRQPQQRYPASVFGMNFAIESYLEAAAEKFIYQFDPACYLYLSRAMDWFDATEGAADLPSALADTGLCSAMVIGVESDILFPVHQQKALAEALYSNHIPTEFVRLSSIQGHDAFLVDYDRFTPAVRSFFTQIANPVEQEKTG